VDKPCESASPDSVFALCDPEKAENGISFFALARVLDRLGLLAAAFFDAIFRLEAFFFADFFAVGRAVRTFFAGVFLPFFLAAIRPKFITTSEFDGGRRSCGGVPQFMISAGALRSLDLLGISARGSNAAQPPQLEWGGSDFLRHGAPPLPRCLRQGWDCEIQSLP
jgi:hypothetical protein